MSREGERVRRWFDRLADLPCRERERRLSEITDPGVQKKVRSLLRHDRSGTSDTFDDLQAPPPEPEYAPGSLIGTYQVLEPIGRGGMGAVYRARREDARLQQEVAIKFVRGVVLTDAMLTRFEREIEILGGLEHPHVPRILDAGRTSDGRPYLVQEYVAGGMSIDTYCDRHRLDVGSRVDLLIQAAEAVAHVHNQALLHRDIKPDNLLVDREGQVKLIDFGIAKLLDPDAREDGATRPLFGAPHTPIYASPEQLDDRPLTAASDVYALGLVLYDLLCGHAAHEVEAGHARLEIRNRRTREATLPSLACRQPTTSPDAELTLDEVATLRGETPSSLRRRLQGDLDAIVMKAIAHAVEERYASADALARDLRRHRSHRPVLAQPHTWSYRTRKLVRRRWPVLSAIGAVVLSLSGAVGIFYYSLIQEETALLRQRVTVVHMRTFYSAAAAYVGGDPSMTVYELFERVEEQVETGWFDGLELELEIRLNLMSTFHQLGEWRRASEQRDRILRRLEDLPTEREREGMLRSTNAPAHLRDLGRYVESEARYEEMMQRHRDGRKRTNQHPESSYAALLVQLGRYDEAASMLTALLPELEAIEGGPQQTPFYPNLRLARIRARQDRVDEALRHIEETERLLDRASELHKAKNPIEPHHVQVYRTEIELARGDLIQARVHARRAAEGLARSLGERHPETAIARLALAEIDLREGALEAARTGIELARDALAEQLPSRHRYTSDVHHALGALLHAEGDLEAAESELREAYQIRSEIAPEADFTGETELALGVVLWEQGRPTEGRPRIEAAITTLTDALGPAHPKTRAARDVLVHTDRADPPRSTLVRPGSGRQPAWEGS